MHRSGAAAVAQLGSIFEPSEGYSESIRMVPWPDSYRPLNGLSGALLGEAYADTVRQAIESFAAVGIKFAGLIVCPIFANEGLPNVPEGYMRKVVGHVRDAGGLYIADEVQAGFGRTGEWWGYTSSGVVPDIVTLGKPMGAGYPIAGVVARGELIDNFRRREMYFNTFGGNPVACAVGMAVLEVLEQENLVDNAATVASLLLQDGQSLKYVSDQLGHSSIKMTADVYGHLVPGANRQAVNRLPSLRTSQEQESVSRP